MAHRRVPSNTLVGFEVNRANGFRGNRISDRRTDRQTDICRVVVGWTIYDVIMPTIYECSR